MIIAMFIEDFFSRALVAGSILALVLAPIGCFIVWRRQAYIGETMANSALLGVVVSLFFSIPFVFGTMLTTSISAICILLLGRSKLLNNDSTLSMLSHTTLAIAIVALYTIDGIQVDIPSILFGDILAATNQDILVMGVVAVFVLLVFSQIWQPLLLITLSQDLYKAENSHMLLVEIIYILLVSLVIAISVQIVGVLLIASLLVIPALAARRLCHSTKAMMFCSQIIAICVVNIGLWLSLYADTPAGASIIIAASGVFILCVLWQKAVEHIGKSH